MHRGSYLLVRLARACTAAAHASAPELQALQALARALPAPRPCLAADANIHHPFSMHTTAFSGSEAQPEPRDRNPSSETKQIINLSNHMANLTAEKRYFQAVKLFEQYLDDCQAFAADSGIALKDVPKDRWRPTSWLFEMYMVAKLRAYKREMHPKEMLGELKGVMQLQQEYGLDPSHSQFHTLLQACEAVGDVRSALEALAQCEALGLRVGPWLHINTARACFRQGGKGDAATGVRHLRIALDKLRVRQELDHYTVVDTVLWGVVAAVRDGLLEDVQQLLETLALTRRAQRTDLCPPLMKAADALRLDMLVVIWRYYKELPPDKSHLIQQAAAIKQALSAVGKIGESDLALELLDTLLEMGQGRPDLFPSVDPDEEQAPAGTQEGDSTNSARAASGSETSTSGRSKKTRKSSSPPPPAYLNAIQAQVVALEKRGEAADRHQQFELLDRALEVVAQLTEAHPRHRRALSPFSGLRHLVAALSTQQRVSLAFDVIKKRRAQGQPVGTPMANVLLAAAACCLSARQVGAIFDSVPEHMGCALDADSYNAIIPSLFHSGNPAATQEALQKLMGVMVAAGLQPDRVTYEQVLLGCIRSGELLNALAALSKMARLNMRPSLGALSQLRELAQRLGNVDAVRRADGEMSAVKAMQAADERRAKAAARAAARSSRSGQQPEQEPAAAGQARGGGRGGGAHGAHNESGHGGDARDRSAAA